MWIPFFDKRLSWLPTYEDRAKYRKQNVEFAKRDMPLEFDEFQKENTKYNKLMKELEGTFSDEQMELYLQARVSWTNASFHWNRYKNCEKTISN